MRSPSRSVNRFKARRLSSVSTRQVRGRIGESRQLGRRPRREGVVLGQQPDQVGVAHEVLAEQLARAQHGAEAASALGRVTERLGERGRPAGARRQPAEAEQPEVGIGRQRQPLEHERQQLLHEP